MPEELFGNGNFKDLNPLTLGSQRCEPGHKFGPHIRDYYLIHYVVTGKGIFITEHGEYRVGKGEIFLIRPGEITTYIADMSDPWHYIWIGFDGALAKKLDTVSPPVTKVLGNVFGEMLEVRLLENTRAEFLASKLFLLFSQLFEGEPRRGDYVEEVAGYINANYMNRLLIDEIADMVKLDRRYLSRLFKARRGVTLKQYITDVKMKKAAALLPQYSVSQVAAMVGYDDVFNFSKMFKKHFGVSPSAYHVPNG